MRALLSGDDRGVADQRVVDTWVWHQVGLELVQVDVEGTVETQAGRDGADNLGDQAVEMLVVGARDIQAAAADVVHGLVVDEEGAVRVLNGAVGRQHGIVGLDDRCRDTWGRVYGKLELALLAVVGREALEEKGSETRTSPSTEGVEDEETLQRRAVV